MIEKKNEASSILDRGFFSKKKGVWKKSPSPPRANSLSNDNIGVTFTLAERVEEEISPPVPLTPRAK